MSNNKICPDASFFGSFVYKYLKESPKKISVSGLAGKFGIFFGAGSFSEYLDNTISQLENTPYPSEEAKSRISFLNNVKDKDTMGACFREYSKMESRLVFNELGNSPKFSNLFPKQLFLPKKSPNIFYYKKSLY